MEARNIAEAAIEEYHMIEKGQKVLVGVSGGPDSMCLLHILIELSRTLDFKVFAAHINHKIRGIEGDLDQEYVKNYCLSNNIPFYSGQYNVEEIARIRKISTETCGREIRYNFFKELSKKLSIDKIALAHNANDNAETLIMRLMRGTGLDGLIGIKPVRDEIFIRPLINVSRKEIEEYCRENNIIPRIDRTNSEAIYKRNKIRLELIPYINQNFEGDIIKSLNKLSRTLEPDIEYLNQASWEKYKEYCEENQGRVIIKKDAFFLPTAILTRIIRKAFFYVSKKNYNLESCHVEDTIKLYGRETGRKINLPEEIVAINNYKDIILEVKAKKIEKNKMFKLNIGENNIKELGLNIIINIIEKKEELIKNSDVKYFDYDKIKGDIQLRFRTDGDRFVPLGMSGEKKLKDLFIDLKIEREKRDEIPLICFGDVIAWVYDYRISDKFKLDKNSKKILEIKIESEDI
ncbi:MAG: tRNA lysidine(34) synthetase TilS [Clostridiaceae bacterium]